MTMSDRLPIPPPSQEPEHHFTNNIVKTFLARTCR